MPRAATARPAPRRRPASRRRRPAWPVPSTPPRRGLTDAVADLAGTLDAFEGLARPQELIEQRTDACPFLLLPVRLECRFTGAAERPELLVRIYPDEIAVHTHEETLTGAELEAGRAFWREVSAAPRAARSGRGPPARARRRGGPSPGARGRGGRPGSPGAPSQPPTTSPPPTQPTCRTRRGPAPPARTSCPIGSS